MPGLITHKFKVANAKRFIDSVLDTTKRHYVFVANHLPNDNDTVPTPPDTSFGNIDYTTHNKILFARHISPSDISLVVDKHIWSSGTVYAEYDDQNPELANLNFFVASQEAGSYNVFVCLSNSNEAPSTSPPLLSETSAEDESYIKVIDGYQWKYMFSIPSGSYEKFSTSQVMPILPNANVSASAVNGAIEVIKVENGGANYNSTHTGFFTDFAVAGNAQIFAIDNAASSDSGFYTGSTLYITGGTGVGQYRNILAYTVSGTQKRVVLSSGFLVFPDSTSVFTISPSVNITGDGQDAAAIARVDPTSGNSVSEIIMLNRGTGYSFANVNITGNTGTNGQSTNSAIARAIISPKFGHGANLTSQLMATKVCISVGFANSENNSIPVSNEYRAVGIIESPLLANITLAVNNNTSFITGDNVIQTSSNAKATIAFANTSAIRLTNVAGTFIANANIQNVANNLITTPVVSVTGYNPIVKFSTVLGVTVTFTGLGGTGFVPDETINTLSASGSVLVSNATHVTITNVKGLFGAGNVIVGSVSGATATINAITPPDVIKYSGEITYIDSVQPVGRTPTQTETIQLVFSF